MAPKGLEEQEEEAEQPVHGMRCESCGDTFTLHDGDEVVCPSCGSTAAHPAHEPFL